MVSLRRKSTFNLGYNAKKPAKFGTMCIRPNEAGAVTRSVPCGITLPAPTAARALSTDAKTSSAWGKKSCPSGVSDTLRVVRWISFTPRLCSSLLIWALETAAESPKSLPAKLILLVAAIFTNKRKYSIFIINKIYKVILHITILSIH